MQDLWSGLITSIFLTIISVAAVVFVSILSFVKFYTEKELTEYAQSGINQYTNIPTNWQKQSSSEYAGLNTWVVLTENDWSIEKKIQSIKEQSEAQLTKRQVENSNPNFHPEEVIPRYFQTFYGDLSIMHARR